ncbi:hypothetical protein, partial [Sulfuracidifex metallicus]|uniref:hypothetical protein n=1 Tax=Sulfuracidifex metallicus TaxID=47303 RepID=UPI002276950F
VPNPRDAQKYRIPKIWKGDMDNDLVKSMLNADPNGPIVMMNAIKAATEATTLILRIDDLVAAGKKSGGAGGKDNKSEKPSEED